MSVAIISAVRRKVGKTFGTDFFDWIDRSYIADWSVASAAWFLAWLIKSLPPFEREFDTKDPLINHAHRPNQISGNLTWWLALLVPLITIAVVSTLRTSAIELHHGLLGLWASRGFTALVTECLKNRVGRLRPDFLSRCKWSTTLQACTGHLDKVMDGRRSFPSGHSSTAFSGMTFLSLWLAGMTGAWCFTQPAAARSVLSSRLARLCLSLVPVTFASWVAISRVEDYRHHKEDVIVGSVIGIVTATVSYLVYWPNPLTLQASEMHRGAARPRIVYRDGDMNRSGTNYDYELAGMENAMEPV